MRQTLNDLEDKEGRSRESKEEQQKEIERLKRGLREAEDKLLLSIEKSNKAEERLHDAEQASKEAIRTA